MLALAATSTAAAAVFLVLPAPVVSSRVNFVSRAGNGGSIGVPGGLAGDSGTAAQLSRAGSPASRIRVGGYLGFAGSLNTALRGNLGNTLVMQVRAQRPSYWVGETFDTWDGQSWAESKPVPRRPLRETSPFILPIPVGNVPFGQSDLQTFYVESSTANLVFHAESAGELWFPAGKVYVAADGTIVSPLGAGQRIRLHRRFAGEHRHPRATPGCRQPLRTPRRRAAAGRAAAARLPAGLALARSVTAHDTTTYDKVESLIGWIGAHTHYSENIPPLPAGADTVDEFLFGNRVGFCEQISTSLAVMLRSLGIPAREAVGYVPGSYDPITDLYQVHANDAHAWVQVWFPGYGWQNFDPTAVVPLSPPSPGSTALHDVGSALRRVPPVPVVALLACGGLVVVDGALAPVTADDVGGAGGPRRRARRWPGGPAPPARRDPGGVRRPARRTVGSRGIDLEPPGRVGRGQRLRGARPAPLVAARAARRGAAHPGPGAGGCGRGADGPDGGGTSDVPVPVGAGARD